MFITFNGPQGPENLGGQVQKLDRSDPRDVKITKKPLMIDELEEKDPPSDANLEMSGNVENQSVQRLPNGGIVVRYSDINRISESILPYPQSDEKSYKWVKSGKAEEIIQTGKTPGFKSGMAIEH